MLAFTAYLPVAPEAALLLAGLAAALAAILRFGPAEPPPSAEVTTAAIFALHGHV